MGLIVLKEPWTRQPPAGTGIDWSNPLARGLKVAVTGANPTVNVATKQVAVAANGVQSVPKSGGLSAEWSSTANTGVKLSDNSILGAASNGATLAIYAAPTASTTPYIVLHCGEGPTTPAWYVYFNATYGDTPTSGMFSLSHQASGAHGVQAAGAVDGKLHLFAITMPGEPYPRNAKAYVDGLDKTSLQASFYELANAINNDHFGGFSSSGYANPGYPLYLALEWDRELSEAELKTLSANPWQIFEP